jgi:hypothetical protein
MKSKVTRLRRAVFFCLTGLIPTAFAQTANMPFDVRIISWAPPAANSDGSPLTDLAGYYIYTGDSPDTLIPHYFSAPEKLGMVIYYPPGGVHYFAVTAINVDGVESVMTPVVGH